MDPALLLVAWLVQFISISKANMPFKDATFEDVMDDDKEICKTITPVPIAPSSLELYRDYLKVLLCLDEYKEAASKSQNAPKYYKAFIEYYFVVTATIQVVGDIKSGTYYKGPTPLGNNEDEWFNRFGIGSSAIVGSFFGKQTSYIRELYKKRDNALGAKIEGSYEGLRRLRYLVYFLLFKKLAVPKDQVMNYEKTVDYPIMAPILQTAMDEDEKFTLNLPLGSNNCTHRHFLHTQIDLKALLSEPVTDKEKIRKSARELVDPMALSEYVKGNPDEAKVAIVFKNLSPGFRRILWEHADFVNALLGPSGKNIKDESSDSFRIFEQAVANHLIPKVFAQWIDQEYLERVWKLVLKYDAPIMGKIKDNSSKVIEVFLEQLASLEGPSPTQREWDRQSKNYAAFMAGLGPQLNNDQVKKIHNFFLADPNNPKHTYCLATWETESDVLEVSDLGNFMVVAFWKDRIVQYLKRGDNVNFDYLQIKNKSILVKELASDLMTQVPDNPAGMGLSIPLAHYFFKYTSFGEEKLKLDEVDINVFKSISLNQGQKSDIFSRFIPDGVLKEGVVEKLKELAANLELHLTRPEESAKFFKRKDEVKKPAGGTQPVVNLCSSVSLILDFREMIYCKRKEPRNSKENAQIKYCQELFETLSNLAKKTSEMLPKTIVNDFVDDCADYVDKKYVEEGYIDPLKDAMAKYRKSMESDDDDDWSD